jgi:hypothetical protein
LKSSPAIVGQALRLLDYQRAERTHLDEVRRYWRGKQDPPAVIPSSVPSEVLQLLKIGRVNICELVVNSLGQSMFMDGFRTADGRGVDVEEFWNVWQRNRFDREQTGVYRAAFAYGTSYVTVLPGDTAPVLRGRSPRSLTALYGEDPDWPMWALERTGPDTFRMFDEQAVYYLGHRQEAFTGETKLTHLETREHGVRVHGRPVCPVVRYVDEVDLDIEDDVDDEPVAGQIVPLMRLQDQIDLTTFELLVAQHYAAFKQRYILGWVAKDEETRLRMGASQTWTFKDHPDDVKIGELTETDLNGYLASREASLRHAASLSQTPAHELIGELVNLSAEALAAAEAGRDRKVDERKTLFGESNEQVAQAVASLRGFVIPDDAQSVWRNTSASSFAAVVDGLGKLATMLGVPPQELWELIPGATLSDVERWKATAQSGDTFARLADMIDRQAAELPEPV